MARRQRAKPPSLGILFWLAVVLLTVAIFLSNRRNIQSVVERTGLRELVTTRTERPTDTIEIVEEDTQPPAEQTASEKIAAVENIIEERSGARDSGDTPQEPAEDASDQSHADEETEREQSTDPVALLRDTPVYFISVTEGAIEPVQVLREVPRSAPMTHTLQRLIEGPTIHESERGLLNLIPPNSELLSASVENGVAYINFNEDFRYNPYGAEGVVAQLQQIVYSVTEFGTIERVQFLINGQRVNYLHSESALYIGEPIGREVFSDV